MVWGKWRIPRQSRKTQLNLTPYAKITSNRNIDLNVNLKTITLLAKKRGSRGKLWDVGKVFRFASHISDKGPRLRIEHTLKPSNVTTI
jgi:hypothetical protein